MALLRLDFCVPRYVLAQPGGRPPTTHPLPSLSLVGASQRLVQKNSFILYPNKTCLCRTDGQQTEQEVLLSLSPHSHCLSSALLLQVDIDAVFVFGAAALSPARSLPLLRACFYCQYPTALIGAARERSAANDRGG